MHYDIKNHVNGLNLSITDQLDSQLQITADDNYAEGAGAQIFTMNYITKDLNNYVDYN